MPFPFIHQSSVAYPPPTPKQDAEFLSMKPWRQRRRADSWLTWPRAPLLIGAELSAVLKQKSDPTFTEPPTDFTSAQNTEAGTKKTYNYKQKKYPLLELLLTIFFASFAFCGTKRRSGSAAFSAGLQVSCVSNSNCNSNSLCPFDSKPHGCFYWRNVIHEKRQQVFWKKKKSPDELGFSIIVSKQLNFSLCAAYRTDDII